MDVQGQGGYVNSPATGYTKGSTNTSRAEEMDIYQELSPPPSTLWGTAAGESGGLNHVSMQRHSDGADGARPESSALARCKYSLLDPEEPAGDPAAAGP